MVFFLERYGCFALSDQPTSIPVPVPDAQGNIVVQEHFPYHLGVRVELWRGCLVILTRDFFFGSDALCTVLLVVYYFLGRTKLLLDTCDLFRLPQHVYRSSGESDDR